MLQVPHLLTCLSKGAPSSGGILWVEAWETPEQPNVPGFEVTQHWEEDSSGSGFHLLSTYCVRDAVTQAFHTLSLLLPPTGGASIIISLFYSIVSPVNKQAEKIEQPEGHPISKSGSRHWNAYLLAKKINPNLKHEKIDSSSLPVFKKCKK